MTGFLCMSDVLSIDLINNSGYRGKELGREHQSKATDVFERYDTKSVCAGSSFGGLTTIMDKTCQ